MRLCHGLDRLEGCARGQLFVSEALHFSDAAYSSPVYRGSECRYRTGRLIRENSRQGRERSGGGQDSAMAEKTAASQTGHGANVDACWSRRLFIGLGEQTFIAQGIEDAVGQVRIALLVEMAETVG